MQASSAIQRLNDYVDQVLSGRLVAGEMVKMVCKHHKQDIRSSKSPEFPWRFDTSLAAHSIEAVESFIKSKHEYSDYKLMGWQCFVIGTMFGWVHKRTGLRRYRRVIIRFLRGNRSFASLLSLYDAQDVLELTEKLKITPFNAPNSLSGFGCSRMVVDEF